MTAFGFLWILVPHPDLALGPNLSLAIGLTLITAGLGLPLWWIGEYVNLHLSGNQVVLVVPAWRRLLMGLSLAITPGSLMVTGAALLAEIIWWLGMQPTLASLGKKSSHVIAGFHPLWTEAILGISILLLTLMAFSIRSKLLIF